MASMNYFINTCIPDESNMKQILLNFLTNNKLHKIAIYQF
jgi:hypothetical protein